MSKNLRHGAKVAALGAAFAAGVGLAATGLLGIPTAGAAEGGPDDDGRAVVGRMAAMTSLPPGQTWNGSWGNNGPGYAYQITPNQASTTGGCILQLTSMRIESHWATNLRTIHYSIKNVGSGYCTNVEAIGSWIR